MDPQTIVEHLAAAERRVTEGRRLVEIQLRIIAGLERDGRDTTLARQLLGALQETQAAYLANRDRLRRELVAAG